MSADLPIDWKSAYCEALYEQREEARQVERREVRFRDGSQPERNRCHCNAERFVRENPGYSVVRGWLRTSIWDFQVMFDAHSLVADCDGQLIEITPMLDGMSLPFLRHVGGEEQFTEFKEGRPSQLILRWLDFGPAPPLPHIGEENTAFL